MDSTFRPLSAVKWSLFNLDHFVYPHCCIETGHYKNRHSFILVDVQSALAADVDSLQVGLVVEVVHSVKILLLEGFDNFANVVDFDWVLENYDQIRVEAVHFSGVPGQRKLKLGIPFAFYQFLSLVCFHSNFRVLLFSFFQGSVFAGTIIRELSAEGINIVMINLISIDAFKYQLMLPILPMLQPYWVLSFHHHHRLTFIVGDQVYFLNAVVKKFDDFFIFTHSGHIKRVLVM